MPVYICVYMCFHLCIHVWCVCYICVYVCVCVSQIKGFSGLLSWPRAMTLTDPPMSALFPTVRETHRAGEDCLLPPSSPPSPPLCEPHCVLQSPWFAWQPVLMIIFLSSKKGRPVTLERFLWFCDQSSHGKLFRKYRFNGCKITKSVVISWLTYLSPSGICQSFSLLYIKLWWTSLSIVFPL